MRSNQRVRIRKARAAAVRGARRTLYDCRERTGQRNVTAAVMTSKRFAIGRQRRAPRERARVASLRARGWCEPCCQRLRVLQQFTECNFSGQVAVVRYDGDLASFRSAPAHRHAVMVGRRLHLVRRLHKMTTLVR